MDRSGTPAPSRKPASGTRPDVRGRSGRRPVVAGGAVVAALVTWAVVDPLLGVSLDARSGTSVQHIGAASVVVASLVAAALAWGSAALIERRWPSRARRVWTVLGCAVLLLSVTGPLSALTRAAVVGLLTLHLVVGTTLVVGLRRTLPTLTGLR
ncbi:MAG: DUF6069 family protein [Lapillicoccus sp.]